MGNLVHFKRDLTPSPDHKINVRFSCDENTPDVANAVLHQSTLSWRKVPAINIILHVSMTSCSASLPLMP